MPARLFRLMLLGDVCIIVAGSSFAAFVATGPWHWSLFWWAMAITAAALLLHGGVRAWFVRMARRRPGPLAERVRARRLMWLGQSLTLVAVGVCAGLFAGSTGWTVVDVVYAVYLLAFLVLLPVVLLFVFIPRARRARSRASDTT